MQDVRGRWHLLSEKSTVAKKSSVVCLTLTGQAGLPNKVLRFAYVDNVIDARDEVLSHMRVTGAMLAAHEARALLPHSQEAADSGIDSDSTDSERRDQRAHHNEKAADNGIDSDSTDSKRRDQRARQNEKAADNGIDSDSTDSKRRDQRARQNEVSPPLPRGARCYHSTADNGIDSDSTDSKRRDQRARGADSGIDSDSTDSERWDQRRRQNDVSPPLTRGVHAIATLARGSRQLHR
ncbi:hypothetical protein MSG28_008654 [Choristoneura fumiferana]|uniref:Uncharacterized protein n=2 Tax=Choristoneura fumiferana TaxID=7141 RepID=A0ACC0J7J2_CHOFU|nr:hypothetical protein MSG28_008654 [Choristoneura fumiferana]